jgi:hypothetical protein
MQWDFTGWLLIALLALIVIIGLILLFSDRLYLIADAIPFLG